jgi:hypothetical protein
LAKTKRKKQKQREKFIEEGEVQGADGDNPSYNVPSTTLPH